MKRQFIGYNEPDRFEIGSHASTLTVAIIAVLQSLEIAGDFLLMNLWCTQNLRGRLIRSKG